MSDCSPETNHSELGPEPAVICVCEMRNITVTLCTVPLMNETPFELMLNGLALIDQKVNPFLPLQHERLSLHRHLFVKHFSES